MISANDLKNGVNFLLEGKPCRVVKYTHQKMGRGGANIKVSIRNLETGELGEKTYKSTAAFEEISTLKRRLQYLYKDGENAFFMDGLSFEQVPVPLSILGDSISFIKEGDGIDVLFWEDPPVGEVSKPLSVELPPKITLKVVEAEPGVKGNSAVNLFKPAKLENGMDIKVPLFIKAGDKIRVDTRTGEYIERAS